MLAAVGRGTPREEVVPAFGLSTATVRRWLRCRRESGAVALMPSPGRTPRTLRTGRRGERLRVQPYLRSPKDPPARVLSEWTSSSPSGIGGPAGISLGISGGSSIGMG
ncbi:helix-turn-helix domain-containing protein [Rubrobacter marinus]|uniref:helix-turn-helix domain-containing protein n=1 Tax=Rubrobacter marinus TaxID=2653852 RepID=UPI001407B5B6